MPLSRRRNPYPRPPPNFSRHSGPSTRHSGASRNLTGGPRRPVLQ